MADRKLSDLAALTTPASADEFLVLDASETTDLNKNKKVQFGTLCNNIPDGSVAAPSLGFASDSGDSGFYRPAEDEIGVVTNDALNSKFTTTGFQVGDGTATAQLHTFKATTGDDVIIENSEAGSTEGPNVVFYRNSPSPAANDILGTLEFRGEDDASETVPYAEITAGIVDPANTSEDGRIDFNLTTAGSLSTVVRLQEGRIGINEPEPDAPIHANNTDTQILRLECPNNDASSGADIRLYRHRNDAVGQNGDQLSTLFFRGHNNDATLLQRPVDYAAIQGQVADVTAGAEDGKIVIKTQVAGTLQTQVDIGNDIVLAPTSGNVGIGTSSPSEKLHVDGNIQIADGGSIISNAGSVIISADPSQTQAPSQISMVVDGTEVADFNNAGYLRFNQTGWVNAGICSQAATTGLNLGGGANPVNNGLNIALSGPDKVSNWGYLARWNTTNIYGWDKTADYHIWYTGSQNERMRIRSNGVINFASCPTYADDAAAGTGGLVAGDVYKTSTGELRIKL